MTDLEKRLAVEFGDARLPSRFWSKVERVPSGCWEWMGSRTTSGYGSWAIDRNRRTKVAHRNSYTSLVGDVPSGLDLDHLCRNRACVNPAHLEPVSRGENVRRGLAPAAGRRFNETKTHCPSGHPYSGDNLYICPKGDRRCKACMRAHQKRYEARRARGGKP